MTRAEVIQMRASRTRRAPTFAKWNFVGAYQTQITLSRLQRDKKNDMIYTTINVRIETVSVERLQSLRDCFAI